MLRLPRLLFVALQLGVIVPLLAGVAPQKLLLDDFETGVAKWTTNDTFKQTGGAEAQLCEIVTTMPGAPEDGKGRAGLVTFRRARESWASVSLNVDGARWAELGAKQLSVWLKGDGSNNTVTLMLRTRGGTVTDERFSTTISLTNPSWQRLIIPLARLKNETRTALDALSAVYLLQCVKVGTWESLFFSLDQLELQGETGGAKPEPSAPPMPPTAPGETPPQIPTGEIANITVDFGAVLGKTRLRLGGSVAAHPERLVDSAEFRRSISDLGLKLIRVNTATLVVPKPEAEAKGEYDFTVLDSVLEAVAKSGAQPLICLADDPAWQLSEDGFVRFCAAVVRRYAVEQKRAVAYYEVFNEPTAGVKAIPIATAVAMYNKVRKAVRAVDHTVKVGGLAEGSAWSPHLTTALTKTDAIDFLSFHFFASRNPQAGDAETMDAATKGLAPDLPHQLAPRAVFETIQRNRLRAGTPLFITECAPNSARDEAGNARDPRLTKPYAAAWWMSFLITAARWVDVACAFDLSDESWGLLDARGRAYPAFYSAWIFSTYAPVGSSVVKSESSLPPVRAFAVTTKTAGNLFLVNTTGQPLTAAVTATGLAELTQVRLRGVEDNTGLKAKTLPLATTHSVPLAPHAVVMVQFVEKKAAPAPVATPTEPGKAPPAKAATPAKATIEPGKAAPPAKATPAKSSTTTSKSKTTPPAKATVTITATAKSKR